MINVRDILVGDATLSVLEIWGAEYQEADALLLLPAAVDDFATLCARERVPVAFVGTVTGDGYITLHDSSNDTNPVHMDLEKVLGNMPQKTYNCTRGTHKLEAFDVEAVAAAPGGIAAALDRVLRLLSVGSKRFLTNKVDRAVTGLVARQQCVGPLHTPLADVAVLALSHLDVRGTATSIGEAPLKGLVSPAAMARMSVGEAITGLAAARITSLSEAKCSANWMWAAKLPHEGAALYDAATAMADFMIATGVAVDGGKDSLSMAAKAPDGELVKAPGTLVISLYAPCPDVRLTLTPDCKGAALRSGAAASATTLLHIDGGRGATTCRVGGSSLAQVFGAVGDVSQVPDCEDPATLVAAFNTIQSLLGAPSLRLRALHDVSDGGRLIAALEMAFAGNCGLALDVPAPAHVHPLSALFSEELGWVAEVDNDVVDAVRAVFKTAGVLTSVMGCTLPRDEVTIAVNGAACCAPTSMTALRDVWEATSFQLERLQANPVCIAEEEAGMKTRTSPPYALSFVPSVTAPERLNAVNKPRVAVIREEGSNGDREMAACLMAAGFEVRAWCGFDCAL